MSFSTHCFCSQVSTPYCNHEACISVVPFRIVGRSISHVDKSTAQWAKCMSPSSPSAAPTPAVCLSDTTRTDVIWCHFKRRISFIPLFSLFLYATGRPLARLQASEQAVSYGPFIGVLTDVVKKGRERGQASVGDWGTACQD